MDTAFEPQPADKIATQDNSILATNVHTTRSQKRSLVNAGMNLLRILFATFMAILAFIFFLAVHEGGHLLADSLVYSQHGTGVYSLKIRVLWLSIKMENGRWFGPNWTQTFSSLARTDYVNPHDPFSITDRETGFMELMGVGTTTLIALTALVGLYLHKNIRIFPWFTVTFVMVVMILDQLIYTFISSVPEPLNGALMMGINSYVFKGIVIGLVLLEAYLLVSYILHYRSSKYSAEAQGLP